MSAAKPLLDNKFLKTLVPLNELTPDLLSELNEKSRVLEFVPGTVVCKIGERDNRTLYLLSGKVGVVDAAGAETMIKADTKQARFPLVNDQPRRSAVVAKSQVTILAVDTDLLDVLLNWDKGNGYQVSDLQAEDETDWMSLFLQSKAFLKLRPDNIQELMMRMDEVPVKAGQVLVYQGATDDSYYIIKSGRCRVSRRSSPDAPEVKLAELSVGTGFGEEALITNGRRNANVTAIEDGCLMRLSKTDFTRLLVQPLVTEVGYEEAKKMPAHSTAWVDVRSLEEFARDGIAGSINVPLAEIRLKLKSLDRNKKFVVYSNTNNRASAAVFLLSQQGMDCVVLANGLADVPDSDRRKGKPKPEPKARVEAPTEQSPAVKEPPTVDNVVRLQGSVEPSEPAGAPAAGGANDPRVFALLNKAKQRVQQESERARTAEEARKRMADEVARLKAEAELAKRQAEEMRAASAQVHVQSEAAVSRARAEESERHQQAIDDASRRSQEEALRVDAAEQARREAEADRARLAQEVETLRKHMEEELQRTAEEARGEAEREASRRREAELAVKQAELETAARQVEQEARHAEAAEQARVQAESEINQLRQEMQQAIARSREEAQRIAVQARAEAEQETRRIMEEAERRQQEAENLARRLEEEALRASVAEVARLEAEQEIERLRGEAELGRLREEEILRKQIEIEETTRRAEQESERAHQAEEFKRQAEAEIERLKREVEAARKAALEQPRHEVDAVSRIAEQQVTRQREAELARKQSELEAVARQAEQEAAHARELEASRLRANTEIDQLRREADEARTELEEKARLAADAARIEAEQLAAVKFEEEMERQQAEIQRLRYEAEQARHQLEEQARASVAKARFEAEKQAKYLRQQELAHKQAELEETARRAEAAEAARRRAEAEIAQLRADADAARAEMERQARIFAAARFDNEHETAQRRQEDMQRTQSAAASAVRLAHDEDIKAKTADLERQRLQQEMERLKAEVDGVQKELKARARETEETKRRGDTLSRRSHIQSGHKDNVFAAPKQRNRGEEARAQSHDDVGDELAAMLEEADHWLDHELLGADDIDVDEPLTSLNDLLETPRSTRVKVDTAAPVQQPPALIQVPPAAAAGRATYTTSDTSSSVRPQSALPKRQIAGKSGGMKRWLIVGVIGVVLVVGGYFLLPEGSPAKVFMARMMSPLQSLFSSGDGTQRREPEVHRQRDPLTELKSRLPMDKKADRQSGVMTGSSVKPVVVANQARREVAVPTPVAEVAVSTAVIDEPAVSDPVAVTQVPVEPMPAADTRRTVIKPEVVVVGGGGVQVKMITPLAPPAQTAEVESSAGQEQAADVSPTVGEAVVVTPVE